MIKRLFLTLTLFISFAAYGQVTFGPRYEAIQGIADNAYLVIPNGEEGVILVWTDYDPQNAVALLSLEFLDKDLKSVWTRNLEMPNRYLLKGYRFVDGITYLLLESTTLDEVKIYKVDPAAAQIDQFNSTEIDEFITTQFEVLQNTAIIGGYIGSRPVVFAYDFNQNQLKALSKIYQNNSMLVEIKINNDGNTFNVLTTSNSENGDLTMLVNTYEYSGAPVRSYRIQTEPNYHLITGASSSFGKEGQVIVGLYGYKGNYPISGIYVNRAQISGEQTIEYHDFTELPQFIDYMGDKAAGKQRDNAKKLKENGKEPLFKISARPRKLIESQGKLVFTGEFFRAYTMASRRNSSLYVGLPNPNLNNMYGHYGYLFLPGDVPNPFMFDQAYTLVLNKDGSIAWDAYTKLGMRGNRGARIISGNKRVGGFLRAVGNFHWQQNQGTYAYYNDQLFVNTLKADGSSTAKAYPLKLKAEGERIVFERVFSHGSLNWYDNYILVYGIQHIKPAKRPSKARRVFFINKVSINKATSKTQLD